MPATVAAALELSMATEKIVETQKGFRGQVMSDEGFLQPYMILDDCAGSAVEDSWPAFVQPRRRLRCPEDASAEAARSDYSRA